MPQGSTVGRPARRPGAGRRHARGGATPSEMQAAATSRARARRRLASRPAANGRGKAGSGPRGGGLPPLGPGVAESQRARITRSGTARTIHRRDPPSRSTSESQACGGYSRARTHAHARAHARSLLPRSLARARPCRVDAGRVFAAGRAGLDGESNRAGGWRDRAWRAPRTALLDCTMLLPYVHHRLRCRLRCFQYSQASPSSCRSSLERGSDAAARADVRRLLGRLGGWTRKAATVTIRVL
jgi:hypothetical protein